MAGAPIHAVSAIHTATSFGNMEGIGKGPSVVVFSSIRRFDGLIMHHRIAYPVIVIIHNHRFVQVRAAAFPDFKPVP